MKSYLLSIGCNDYASETLNNLTGAENDATNVYNQLVLSEYSIYDKNVSKILLSPSLSDVKSALESILCDFQTSDIFTLFFAGHGGVLTGTYYLCTSDTRLDRMNFSAFSLTEILRIVSSSGVKHVNLVIDACNTGGLVNDLTSIIKPEIMGAKGSFGIAILAAAASDENAGEVAGQGLLTSALIDCLNGTRRVTGDTEFLDLVTVGRVISADFVVNTPQQTPSSWGINLYGPSIFAKNPFYNSDEVINAYEFSYIPPASRLGKLIHGSRKEFWEALEKIDDADSASLLLRSFQRLLKGTDSINDALALITGIGYQFVEQVDASSNLSKLELINVMLVALMPYIGNSKVNVEVDKLISAYSRMGGVCLNALHQQMNGDNQLLIYKEGKGIDVLANYFYLPIRISKILGLISQLALIDQKHLPEVRSLLQMILESYSNHLLCMCDSQAPYLYVFFKTFLKFGIEEEAKPLLTGYLFDYLQMHGQVSRLNIQPEKVFHFLLQRNTQRKINADLVAQPDELGTALLLASTDYGIADDLDEQIHALDRRSFLLFIPSSYKDFCDNLIRDGQNLVLRCGFDFWSAHTFKQICSTHIEQYSKSNFKDISDPQLFCCIASSFIQPDRLPIMLR
ncbi:MAG: Caspase domain-containing protein [Candidatus Nitrotoga sp. LAW]|nr:MAG: Caspase domain-containing protein [Candidatus Nitrotoga sp. LAW]